MMLFVPEYFMTFSVSYDVIFHLLSKFYKEKRRKKKKKEIIKGKGKLNQLILSLITLTYPYLAFRRLLKGYTQGSWSLSQTQVVFAF